MFFSLFFLTGVSSREAPKIAEKDIINVDSSQFDNFKTNVIKFHDKSSTHQYLNSTTIIKDATFTNNNGFLGGAIYITSETTLISHCTFSHNTANQGSSIYLVGSKFFNINQTVHIKNVAKNIAPALFLDSHPKNKKNLVHKNNFTSLSSIVTSAVMFCGVNPEVTESLFTKLTCDFCGALQFHVIPRRNTNYVKDTTFINCTSKKQGASISCFSYNVHTEVRRSIFKNCVCSEEKGILFYTTYKKCTALFINCELFGDKETFFGEEKLKNVGNITLCNIY